jgi:hypothetical protein
VTLSLRDSLREPVGRLKYDVFRRGELIEQFDERNLIVIGSQPTHAALLGGNVANNSVTQIGFGTNATAAAFGNTSLSGPPYLKNVDGASYPASNEVQFAFSLGLAGGDASAYGLAISEFGLLTTAGVLYARRVRSAPLNFASDISIQGTWTISF